MRRSVLVRRLLEIDTYRSMVLLALSLARRTAPEDRHGGTGVEPRSRDAGRCDHHRPRIQTALSSLPSAVDPLGRTRREAQLSPSPRKAYGEVLHARLDSLREGPTPHRFEHQALSQQSRRSTALQACLAL